MRAIALLLILGSGLSARVHIVAVGDSHMMGYLQPRPITSLISGIGDYDVVNLAVGGSNFCEYFADNGQRESDVDSRYDSSADLNVLIIEGGGNDVLNSNGPISPQAVYRCQKEYGLRRKANKAWSIVIYGMYSRFQVGYNGHTGDQLHNALNGFYSGDWFSWADAYANVGADPDVGPDNSWRGPCFVDGAHVAGACMGPVAEILSTAIRDLRLKNATLLQSSGSYVGSQLILKNKNPRDFSASELQGDTQRFLIAVGNSLSPVPGEFLIYDRTNLQRRFSISKAGTVSIDGLGGGSTSPVCADWSGALVRCR